MQEMGALKMKENQSKSNYSLANLMRLFIEKETGKKISRSSPRADMIKCLLMQEFNLGEDAIIPLSKCFDQRPQVIYGHLTTQFAIKFGDYKVDIITAEDNRGFLMLKSELVIKQQFPFSEKPIYQPAPPTNYFNPLIKFFDVIMCKQKLIDFKFIPEEYQKYYERGDTYVFLENHLWEGDEQTAEQIVEDLYHHEFDSTGRKAFFEARYNDGYGSAKLKLWTWDQMRRQVQNNNEKIG